MQDTSPAVYAPAHVTKPLRSHTEQKRLKYSHFAFPLPPQIPNSHDKQTPCLSKAPPLT